MHPPWISCSTQNAEVAPSSMSISISIRAQPSNIIFRANEHRLIYVYPIIDDINQANHRQIALYLSFKFLIIHTAIYITNK